MNERHDLSGSSGHRQEPVAAEPLERVRARREALAGEYGGDPAKAVAPRGIPSANDMGYPTAVVFGGPARTSVRFVYAAPARRPLDGTLLRRAVAIARQRPRERRPRRTARASASRAGPLDEPDDADPVTPARRAA